MTRQQRFEDGLDDNKPEGPIAPWRAGGGFRIPQWARGAWSWEVLSMLARFGCMAGIVAILVLMDDRSLADTNFFLHISATVGIFGTALKSTAAFIGCGCMSQYKWLHFKPSPRKLADLKLIDEASRGPLGSFSSARWGWWASLLLSLCSP
ncbi:hypothetical protein VTH06DRAFT_8484 [Thermothelomyces fergusii]